MASKLTRVLTRSVSCLQVQQRLIRTSAIRFAGESNQDKLLAQRFANADKLVNPSPAIDLIHEQPIAVIDGRVAVTGGEGRSHPVEFLNLDQDKVVMCPYSGDFFVKKSAIKKLLKRGAIVEKDGQFFKVKEVTDEE